MDLEELSREYRRTGEMCRAALFRLREQEAREELSETERLRLRRRICVVAGMARDALALSNYLARYYEGRGAHADPGPMVAGGGLSGAAEISPAGGVR